MLEKVIRRAGFELVRQKKHRVYTNSVGQVLVTSSTPSDWRADRQTLSILSRLTGKSKRELLRRPRPNEESEVHVKCPLATSGEVVTEAPGPVAVEALPMGEATQPRDSTKPWTRAELVLLRHMEKRQARQAAKAAKQLARLRGLVSDVHHFFLETEVTFGEALSLVYDLVREAGFEDVRVRLMTVKFEGADRELESAIISVNGFVLDFISNQVRQERHWKGEFPDGEKTRSAFWRPGTLPEQMDMSGRSGAGTNSQN